MREAPVRASRVSGWSLVEPRLATISVGHGESKTPVQRQTNDLIGYAILGIPFIALLFLEPIFPWSTEWYHATFYTVVIFGSLVGTLSPMWREKRFWSSILKILVAHSALMIVSVKFVPSIWRGAYIVLIPLASLELFAAAIYLQCALRQRLRG
jgi:hypothetical protein